MWILIIMAWLNKASMSCNIFRAFLFSSGKYKISCILQSVSSRFVEKWFFICETNQFVRSNKLLWSAEFFASFPLKVEMITSFTIRFLSFPTWCGNSCWIFLMWLEISCKGSLTRISYFFRFEVPEKKKDCWKEEQAYVKSHAFQYLMKIAGAASSTVVW